MNNNSTQKRILIVNTTLDIGGIESFLANLSENIDKKNYNIFFLTYSNKKFDFEDKIIKSGSTILRKQSPKKISKIAHLKQLIKIIKKVKPDVVHSNTYFDSLYVLLAALYCSVPVRIAHSHTSRANSVGLHKKVQHTLARPAINLLSTENIACSKDAGIALFGRKQFRIIPNGVNEEKFIFDYTKRAKLREKLGADKDTVIVGHIGRLDKVKNHKFLLKLFHDYHSLKPNSFLLLAGQGPERQAILKKAKSLGIHKRVFLFEKETDTSCFYSAMDVLVFPSIYEGLPLALVEAQLNELPIFASNKISNEVKFTKNIKFIDLDDYQKWLNYLLDAEARNIVYFKDRKETPYSIKRTLKVIYDVYSPAETNNEN